MYKLDFYTQYNQFYILDKGSPARTDSPLFWTDEALQARLAVEEGILGVGTECYGSVKASITIRDRENLSIDLIKYDHIVEGSIKITSGVLQVIDCPTSSVELQIEIPKGQYRVRIYSLNLSSVVGDDGDDCYEIELWQDEKLDRRVLKRFNN